MTIADFKKYIEDCNLPDDMQIIINNNFVTGYGLCVVSPMQRRIGPYLSIDSDRDENMVYDIRRKEKWLKNKMKHYNIDRDKAKELYIKEIIEPYAPKCFGKFHVDNIFNYELENK